MIYYVTTERYSSTVRRFLAIYPHMRRRLASLTYEEIFFERAGPVGHYIFTDFDRLTSYEVGCAARYAAAVAAAAPDARILNHPLRALERLPLLVALHRAGINDFAAVRLDAGERPPRYPVFIRAEDGYGAPETDLLADDAAFDAACDAMRRRGLPLKGRIAVGYAAEKGADGFFRKYGAFNLGGTIVPYHLMLGPTWVVKRHVTDNEWIQAAPRWNAQDVGAVAEELAYVRDNPHRDDLTRAFALAGIDFGRADYGVVGGRVQIYEINTNPSLPGNRPNGARRARGEFVQDALLRAFDGIDAPVGARGRVRYTEDRPRPQNVHWPRRRLAASLSRRLWDGLTSLGRRRAR